MKKDKFSTFQNPLSKRKEQINISDSLISENTKQSEIEKNKIIQKFGNISNITSNLINLIDFDNKEFINRIYNSVDELKNDELNDLIESIKEIGLINSVYLIEKDNLKNNKKFIIVSGLRRLLAIKSLIEAGETIREINRVIIFSKDTPVDVLNKISIDENTKRKDLTMLELSYKLRKDSKIKKIPIEQLMSEHNLNRRKFFRITKIMDYPKELQEIVDEIGVNKAETINKILKINKYNEDIRDIISRCQIMTERELNDYYKKVAKKEKKTIDIKINNKNTQAVIKINKKITPEIKQLLKEFNEKIENL
ncbi:ParB-like nuclease family protein [Hypnocyclicus thermotrophus]|uniref:ParB-like nuclease family protein n=1 Tax=Hypnocyclicus thermotrophus TaxID=1627895 RepID=A0AA46E020_9FUSO|nr:ParB N-terminal domain-containing protein [Hypnocyclicus thermotrophus]TDT72319.1 ParB-like nuclease family protein [Hypnocyclicus thermotrophus]